jgi:hypothetical protein
MRFPVGAFARTAVPITGVRIPFVTRAVDAVVADCVRLLSGGTPTPEPILALGGPATALSSAQEEGSSRPVGPR